MNTKAEDLILSLSGKLGEACAHVEIALRNLPRLLSGFDKNTLAGMNAAECLLHLREAQKILTPPTVGQVSLS